MDEHLQSINENTNEITSNYEYITELEAKVEKLTERLDQMQNAIHSISQKPVTTVAKIKPLTREEEEVFIILYTLQEEKGSVTFTDIAKKTDFSEELVSDRINSMIEKGIPITKKFINSEPYLRLDKDFKTLQAKENVLKITPN